MIWGVLPLFLEIPIWYHMVYLVGTVSPSTRLVKTSAGLCRYHWCNDALCQRRGSGSHDPWKNQPTHRPHPSFSTKSLAWWIMMLPKKSPKKYRCFLDTHFFSPPWRWCLKHHGKTNKNWRLLGFVMFRNSYDFLLLELVEMLQVCFLKIGNGWYSFLYRGGKRI